MYDIQPDFADKVKKLVSYMRPVIDEYDTLLSGNVILQERLRNVGILAADKAIGLGCTGPVLRGSGVAYDVRKAEPYGVYDKVDFDVVVGTKGDCWDRYYVRIEEMRQSLRIVEQLLERDIPEGPHMVAKFNTKIKLPEGIHYGQVETAKGALGVFIVSDGVSDKPYRLHFRSPNFNNLWAVTEIAPGWRIADLIAIQSSLDLVVPDIDR
jgi:NADH-quinone oxidoreductase subunit D